MPPYAGPVSSVGRRLFGILWTLALAWILFCAWSFWVAEASPLERYYFTVRDWIQPRGYAVGRLHRAPTWAVFHLALGACAPLLLFGMRALTRRR